MKRVLSERFQLNSLTPTMSRKGGRVINKQLRSSRNLLLNFGKGFSDSKQTNQIQELIHHRSQSYKLQTNFNKIKLPQLRSPDSKPKFRTAQNKRQLSRTSLTTSQNAVIKCGYKTVTGRMMGKIKQFNQDSYLIRPLLKQRRGNYLFGVFDGHGSNGHMVSQYIKQHLPEFVEMYLVEDNPSLYEETKVQISIRRSVKKIINGLRMDRVDTKFSGSTFNVVVIRGKHLTCANIGDSKSVLGKFRDGRFQAYPLSSEHKPENPEEYMRIIQQGGRIQPYVDQHNNQIGPQRIWLRNQNLPGLAMSRSIGDSVAASVGVTSNPDYISLWLTEEDKFVILASDGIWEFITDQEAVQIVGETYKYQGPEASCSRLVEIAQKRWAMKDLNVDDITVIVAYLQVMD